MLYVCKLYVASIYGFVSNLKLFSVFFSGCECTTTYKVRLIRAKKMLPNFWVRGLIILSVVFNPVLTRNVTHNLKQHLTHDSTLKLLIVFARHGDRIPQPPQEFYPNDPYLKRNFNPPGYGKLTESGKLRELNLGKFLRKTYVNFFGPKYIDGYVEARSTSVNRTKESVHLILKGLYPEAVIASKFESKMEDVMFFPELCPAYMRDYVKAKSEKKAEFVKLHGFMTKLSKWTGKNINSAIDMYHIYTTLEAEKFMHLALPSWTNGVYPDGDLLKGSVLEFDIMNNNEKMIQRNGGRMVKKIVEDLDSVKNGYMDNNRKLILYAAHDLNIVALLKALDVYFPHVPKFSSAVVIELHQIKEDYYVKINYHLGVPAEMRTLKIPRCETLCPLDEFSGLLQNIIPVGHQLICDKVRAVLGAEPIAKSITGVKKMFKHIFSG